MDSFGMSIGEVSSAWQGIRVRSGRDDKFDRQTFDRVASKPYTLGMTVTLDMPKEIEAQFTAAAQARGVPLSV